MKLLVLLVRILICPFVIIILLVTAFAELCDEQDWDYWKKFNKRLLRMLYINVKVEK